jgi:D-xylonolactonase
MSQTDVIADYGDLCGEGPIWDASSSALYWTDITGRRFYRCSWPQSACELLDEGFEVAGCTLRDRPGFVVVNSGGFWLWEPGGSPRLIAAEAEGKRCVLNDCIADPEGRVYSGSCLYDAHRPGYELGCLFRLDPDGSVHVADEGFRIANGLGFSPDERTLYFTDSAARVIYAYDYSRKDGTLRNRRVFAEVPVEEGLPDGLTVDAEGFVWSARWFGGCVVRYDPDGKVERRVAIPATETSSLAFGGPELTDIFVTSASSAEPLELAPAGYRPENVYSGGKLFHLNLGIPGRNEYRTRVV